MDNATPDEFADSERGRRCGQCTRTSLLIIVALTFAVRGDVGSKIPFTVLAAAVAAALSIVLNLLAKTMNVTIREPALISAYTSTILVMLCFIFVRAFFFGTNWYEDWLGNWLDEPFAAASLSVVVVYMLLTFKAILWDKHKVSSSSAAVGFGTVVGSGIIVCIVYILSNRAFELVIDWLSRL